MLQNLNVNRANCLTGLVLVILIMIYSNHAFAFNNPPERCAGFGNLQSISLTDWETGLGLWTVGTHDIANPGDFDTPNWAVVENLPDSRLGKAAFVVDQDDWEICETLDKAGALTLDSPVVVIPGGTLVARISIDHWFAIEKDWDGGNFKISVNGSGFNLIPVSAIEVGPYNDALFAALTDLGEEFNTNPLAGQEAFTGPLLSWGQSHINLLGIAAAGDSIQLRFDFGIDECAGDIGWYVDDVEFYSCSAEVPPSKTSLSLVKQVINDNNGGASASDWTLIADGPTPISGTGPNVSSENGFAPGTYKLSESGGPTGYSPSSWVCVGGTQINADTIILAMDEIVTCTITNNDIAPTLKVVNTIINDNGGTVTDPNAFGLKVDGGTVLHSVSKAFSAGNHTVSQQGLADYEASIWGGDCSSNGTITLALAQNATCTITNNDIDLSDIIFRNGFE